MCSNCGGRAVKESDSYKNYWRCVECGNTWVTPKR